MSWWNYAEKRRREVAEADEREREWRERDAERRARVSDDVYALRDELAGWSDIPTGDAIRAVVAHLARLHERVNALEQEAADARR